MLEQQENYGTTRPYPLGRRVFKQLSELPTKTSPGTPTWRKIGTPVTTGRTQKGNTAERWWPCPAWC